MSRDLHALRLLCGRYAMPHAGRIALLVPVSVLAALFTALQPLTLAPALDAVLLSTQRPADSWQELDLNNMGRTIVAWLGLENQRPFEVLLACVGLFLAVVLASALLGFLGLQLVRDLRTHITTDLQSDAIRHTLALSMPFFVSHRVGDLVNRFVFDAVAVGQAIDSILRAMLQACLQLLILGFVLLKTDAELAGTVAVVGLLHVVITRALQRRVRRAAGRSFDSYGSVAAFIQETLLSVRIVKSFSAEAYELQRLRERLADLRRSVLNLGFYTNAEMPLRQLADGVALGVLLLVSFLALSSGRLTLAGFGLFILIVRQAIPPMAQLGTSFVQTQRLLGTSGRLLELIEARPRILDGPREAEALRSGLELKGVHFSHRPGVPALRGIDMRIPRGSVVALVGPSGSGKSTLADLVLRLYDPDEGRVYWDGVDVREFRQASYRRHIGVVPQEALLLNASIAENIVYGRPLDRQAIEEAARIAHVEEFARHLPEGYEAGVGDRGIRLSGGQRQRVALARALYGQPEVLILDEATSSLDSESERAVHAAIDDVLAERTALVIAHRLSTVRRADVIVVLRDGQIQDLGPHERLLETSSLYRRLHATQFRDEPIAVTG